jgi:hypothetical protein
MVEIDDSANYHENEDISKPHLKASAKDEVIIRKVICRYGCGCTHLLDATHREKFWHPKIQRLEGNFSL